MTPVLTEPGSDFAAALDGYGRLVGEAIRPYVADRQPRRYLYEPMEQLASRPGKALRPALCLAACEAFGGSAAEALCSAVAVELLHVAFLIHDDIEDGALQRRGRPTLHTEMGVPVALNTGDALAVLAQRPLLDNLELLGSRMTRAVVREFQVAMERTVEGQALELGWRRDNVVDLTPRHYLELVLLKTCAYSTVLPLRVGSLIGSWGGVDLGPMAHLGFLLGAAFQIRDDVLDLISDRDSYGKDPLGDIREGKRTLPLIHLLANATPSERSLVVDHLSRPEAGRSAADAERIRDLMVDHGSLAFAERYAEAMAEEASELTVRAFAGCGPSQAMRFLDQSVSFMVGRVA